LHTCGSFGCVHDSIRSGGEAFWQRQHLRLSRSHWRIAGSSGPNFGEVHRQ